MTKSHDLDCGHTHGQEGGTPVAALPLAPVEPTSGSLEHWVDFRAAYDKKAEGYGIGSMKAIFYARGPKGAVQWMIGLPFYTASVRPDAASWPPSMRAQHRPEGWDLGYHAHEPQYDGQTAMQDDCEITGGPCFYAGSGLNADLLIEGFIEGGTEWLWPQLDAYYRCTFEGEPWPFEGLRRPDQ